jgi:hypothetical protein
MKSLADVTKSALELSPEQQVTLARILLDRSQRNLDPEPEIDRAWHDEICRRIKAIEAGTAKSRSFEAVFADLDRKFPS